MGFNLGAFAGGVAQAGMASYKTQQELALKRAAEEREAERLGFERERMLREKEQYGQTQESAALLKQAYTPTEGGTSVQDIGAALPIGARAGEDTTTPEYRAAFQQALAGMTPAQQAAVLRGYGDVNAPGGKIASAIPDLQAAQLGTTTVRQDETGKTYAVQPLTGDKAADRYEQLAGAAGNPMAMKEAVGLKKSQAEIAAAKQNLELGSQTLDLNKFKLTKAKTDQEFDEKFQGALKDVMTESAKTLDKIKTTAETGGMKGLVDTFGSQLKTAFKHDISLVGNNIIVKDNDGKTLHTINSTAEAVSLLEGAAKEQFNKSLSDKMVTSGLFRNPEELNTFVKNQRDYNVSMMNAVSSRMQAEASQATGQLARDKFVKMSDAELAELRAKTEAHQADAAWRTAAAASMSEKPKNWELVGVDSDGVPISHNKNDNTFARSDGAAIKNYDFFKKFTGDKSTINTDLAAQEKFVTLFGSQPSLFKDPKAGDQAIPINKLSPNQLIQQMQAQRGDNGTGALPDPDVEKMKKTPAAGTTTTTTTSTSALPTGPNVQSQIEAAKAPIKGDFEAAYAQAQRAKTIDADPNVIKAKEAIRQAMGQGGSAGLGTAQKLQSTLDGYIAKNYPVNPAVTTVAPAPAATPASSTKISKAQQQLNDTDRPGIIQAELDKAQARLAGGDATAQADVNSLTRELARLPRVTAIPVTPQALANAEKRLAGDAKAPRNISEKDIQAEMAAIRATPSAKGMKESTIREIAITMLSK